MGAERIRPVASARNRHGCARADEHDFPPELPPFDDGITAPLELGCDVRIDRRRFHSPEA